MTASCDIVTGMSPLLFVALLATSQPQPVCEPAPLVIGHRGSGSSSADNPYAENTLPSIRKAFEYGADMVEIDVQLSSDGVAVLMHDATLKKTTGLPGCLADYTYAELATADATLASGATSAAPVPSLAEALEVTTEFDRKLNIELKIVTDENGSCPLTDIDELVNAVEAAVVAASAESSVLISSFSFEALSQVERIRPELQTGLLTTDAGGPLVELADSALNAGIDAINPLYISVSEDPDTAAELLERMPVYPWTVNDTRFMEKLLAIGVAGIITDEVSALRALIDEMGVKDCTPPRAVEEKDEAGGCGQGASPLWFAAASLPILVRRVFRRG